MIIRDATQAYRRRVVIIPKNLYKILIIFGINEDVIL